MNKYNPRGFHRFHVQQLSQLHQSCPLADRIPAWLNWIPTPSRSKQQMKKIVAKNTAAANESEMLCLGRLVSKRRTRLPVAPVCWKWDRWLFLWGRDVGVFPDLSLFLSSFHCRWQLSFSFGGCGENESTQILKNQPHTQKGFKKLSL